MAGQEVVGRLNARGLLTSTTISCPNVYTHSDIRSFRSVATSPQMVLQRDRAMRFPDLHQAVGTVPPSMTYSVPVIAPALGETTNAMSSATSRGVAGRPSGMPPSDFMMICLPPS
jgi:hypothetical protein